MEETNPKCVITFVCDDEGFVTMDANGAFRPNSENDVPSKLYELCCNVHKEIINWRTKNLRK